jgi:hypothetical protein
MGSIDQLVAKSKISFAKPRDRASLRTQRTASNGRNSRLLWPTSWPAVVGEFSNRKTRSTRMTRATSSSDYSGRSTILLEKKMYVLSRRKWSEQCRPLISDQLIRHSLHSTVSIFHFFLSAKAVTKCNPFISFKSKWMNYNSKKKNYTEQSIRLTWLAYLTTIKFHAALAFMEIEHSWLWESNPLLIMKAHP